MGGFGHPFFVGGLRSVVAAIAEELRFTHRLAKVSSPSVPRWLLRRSVTLQPARGSWQFDGSAVLNLTNQNRARFPFCNS
jgi:hypothetical protein